MRIFIWGILAVCPSIALSAISSRAHMLDSKRHCKQSLKKVRLTDINSSELLFHFGVGV